MLAVVMAAWRSVPGAESIDQGLSLSDVANDMAQTSHGMRMAIPEDAWRVFSRMRPAAMVATLRELAQTVRRKAYRNSSRGPKNPRPKRAGTTQSSHVSTAKILRDRKVKAATPEQGWTEILKFQPVATTPDDDWTDSLHTAVGWLRSGVKKKLRAQ